MKILGEIAKLIITLILAVLIIVAILLNTANKTILKEEYVLQKLEQSNYYETTYQEIIDAFDNYILQSGLEEDTLEGICSKEQVKEDTQKIIQNMYEGTENKITTDSIKEKLNAKIQEQLDDTVITPATNQAINQLIDTIAKEYDNKIMQTNYEQKINTVIEKANSYIDIFQKVVYVSIIVLVIILFIISIKKQKARFISWLGISILTAGATLVIIKIFITSQVTIENIKILTSSISKAIHVISNDILSMLFTSGIVLILIGIIAVIIGNVINSNKHKKE